ncbi:MAG: dual specificity protein phosphatase family protein [Anaerolineae bacterium]|nr:dual specificity protein phosphatase family protein [Anaerolineae bacterium]
MPIRDGDTPAAEGMKRILDAIDAAIEQGCAVHVHCWGGIGRTGTVVGCCLVRHGMSGPQALAEIARRRAGTPGGHRCSPETDEREQSVLSWPAGG